MKLSVNPPYLNKFPSVAFPDTKVFQGTFLRENNSSIGDTDFDGRTAFRVGGFPPLSGHARELIGFEPRFHRDSMRGILRSRFTAVGAEPVQVGANSLTDFLSIKSGLEVADFAAKNGFLGLYETLQVWRNAEYVDRVFGEPVDSWLYHVDKLKTLNTLLQQYRKGISPKTLSKRIDAILNRSVSGCSGQLRYSPHHDANDRVVEDPVISDLKTNGNQGCWRFCKFSIEQVLLKTVVVYDFTEGSMRFSSNCCLGFLYMQLALQHGVMLGSNKNAYAICRWCRAQIQLGTRGPTPSFCRACLNARSNYSEAEAYQRRIEIGARTEKLSGESNVADLISEYTSIYGDVEGIARAERALMAGLSSINRA
ncbi:hypothetical protein IQ258_23830 [Coleofasciculus sp. LEGE 07081]|uniref:hypothetical protein n=1 Tax=Coleofasciculus sp. LEGE 07081 TaxID=2777967 RepID=UPI001882591C|nr:hypothetical protein [Coleofasciculus sp. LEGE 07081]MBE9129098.1 hypothetical protein [Coleofasciculus sp. LEGE 07081]